MSEEQLIMLGASVGAIIFGIVCMTVKPVYQFMNRTKTGQKWVRWFGEDKATLINRFIVPAFLVLGGLFILVMSFSSAK